MQNLKNYNLLVIFGSFEYYAEQRIFYISKNILDFVAKSSRTEATSLLSAFKRLKLVLLLRFNFCTKIGFTVIVVNNSLAAFLVLTALPPKVLNAQCFVPHHLICVLQRTVRFCEQLATVIPNAHVYYRRGLALKRIIPQCVARNFTYLMVINEDRQVPSILKGSCASSSSFFGQKSHFDQILLIIMKVAQTMEIFDAFSCFLKLRSLTIN